MCPTQVYPYKQSALSSVSHLCMFWPQCEGNVSTAVAPTVSYPWRALSLSCLFIGVKKEHSHWFSLRSLRVWHKRRPVAPRCEYANITLALCFASLCCGTELQHAGPEWKMSFSNNPLFSSANSISLDYLPRRVGIIPFLRVLTWRCICKRHPGIITWPSPTQLGYCLAALSLPRAHTHTVCTLSISETVWLWLG